MGVEFFEIVVFVVVVFVFGFFGVLFFVFLVDFMVLCFSDFLNIRVDN